MYSFTQTELDRINQITKTFSEDLTLAVFEMANRHFGLPVGNKIFSAEQIHVIHAAMQSILIISTASCPSVQYRPMSFIDGLTKRLYEILTEKHGYPI